MIQDEKIIKVGVGCLVFKDGKVLLGRRKSKSHGDGEYTCGGGHAEFMEDLSDTARREIQEEWGIEIDEPEFLCVTNLKKYGKKHYVDIGFRANWKSGEPNPAAEDEFTDFDWYDLDNIPAHLFGVVPNYLEAIKSGKTYFETSS